MNSMTGFGSREANTAVGRVSVEVRSANHKFLEAVIHLPPGYLALEDKIRKLLEGRVKRGRLMCVVTLNGTNKAAVHVDENLLRSYVHIIRTVKQTVQSEHPVSLDTVLQLPGVLRLEEKRASSSMLWLQVRPVAQSAVEELLRMRAKEGKALCAFLRSRSALLNVDLSFIKQRFRTVLKDRSRELKTDDERVSFLKGADITEEIERLTFHIRNFESKTRKKGPIGKELDFIAQEMQREANTLAAKSCDMFISARVVQMKSQIERIREQVQNAE